MNIDYTLGFARSIQGQLLRRSERREVAIFLLDGALWVADFIDGEGKLVDATTWFRFNCASLSSVQARRRMVLEAAIPLSPELVARIGRLRDPATTRKCGAVGWLLEAIATHRARGRLAAMVARLLANASDRAAAATHHGGNKCVSFPVSHLVVPLCWVSIGSAAAHSAGPSVRRSTELEEGHLT